MVTIWSSAGITIFVAFLILIPLEVAFQKGRKAFKRATFKEVCEAYEEVNRMYPDFYRLSTYDIFMSWPKFGNFKYDVWTQVGLEVANRFDEINEGKSV